MGKEFGMVFIDFTYLKLKIKFGRYFVYCYLNTIL